MTEPTGLDSLNRQILHLLQQNARLSFAELARHVGLSPAEAAERVHWLEQAGIITQYTINVDGKRAGLPLTAFIRVNVPIEQYADFIALASVLPQIIEGHHITGADAFMLKVAVASPADLERLVSRLGQYGQTTTSVVLSSPIAHPIEPPAAPE